MRIKLGLAAFLFGIAAAHSDPNDYNRTIAFGDSLSDNGNLYKNLGQPLSPPYDQRFSNGPTWIELISNPAKSTDAGSSMNRFWGGVFFLPPYNNGGGIYNVNAAIGGAQTIQIVPGITGQTPLSTPPSVANQIGAFAATGGKFGANDLVSVQGGANDIFNYFKAVPTASQTDLVNFATQDGVRESANVAAVIAAGAKTVIVSNIPNIGATPAFNGTQGTPPLVTSAATLAAGTYNTALDQATRQIAAANPGVNVVQMDWAALLRVAAANPAAFGLTNVVNKCLNAGNTAISAACATAGPNTYLFWDDVHPTEAGHLALARYATLLLSTEATGRVISTLGQFALQTRLEGSDILFRRGAAPGADRPGGLYAEVLGQSGSVDGARSRVLGGTDIDYGIGGVRGGFDANAAGLAFGAAISYQGGSLNGSYLKSDLRVTQLDAYAMTRFASFFAGVEGGVSFNEYSDISRATGIPTVNGKGSSRGVDYSVAATLGMQREFGAVTLTPAARVGYASVNIDGYTESADLLALQYGDREISTGFWTVRLRAATPFMGYRGVTIFGEVGYEDLFSESGSYTAKLFNNTAQGVNIAGDSLDGRGLILKAGIGGHFSDNMKISGEYGYSNQNGNGDVHSGRVQLTIPLGIEAGLKD